MTDDSASGQGKSSIPHSDPKLAVLVPCYNAGPRLSQVIQAIVDIHPRVFVVDDGSTDGATRMLGGMGIELITLPVNRGKGHALLAGFTVALADPNVDCVATMDADGQHDPRELHQLVQVFRRNHADLLIGSRVFTGSHVPFRSRLGNVFTSRLTKLLLGKKIPDTQSGYRLHSRKLLDQVLKRVPGGRYETEMEILVLACRRGFNVAAEPIATIYEDGNRSSHFSPLRDSWRIYRKLFAATLKSRD
jgi:glycosyltransferase involved in cell wall biosynthesis